MSRRIVLCTVVQSLLPLCYLRASCRRGRPTRHTANSRPFRSQTSRSVTGSGLRGSRPIAKSRCHTTSSGARRHGRFANFAVAAGLEQGKFEGIYFNDSDVYKVLEGAAYSLADHPDPVLDQMTDEVIRKIAAAQRPSGYLNTYYTLVEPGNEWTECGVKHEMYCAGHLIEAAVAHFRATGKRTLLDVAIKFADYLDSMFGPGKRTDVPGHEELELALVKLYELTGETRYLKLSQFYLQARGNPANRPNLYGEYCQDHCPVAEQTRDCRTRGAGDVPLQRRGRRRGLHGRREIRRRHETAVGRRRRTQDVHHGRGRCAP